MSTTEHEEKERVEAMEVLTFIISVDGTALSMPAINAWAFATALKEGFLDRYELTQGVPTTDEPNPLPHFILRGE